METIILIILIAFFMLGSILMLLRIIYNYKYMVKDYNKIIEIKEARINDIAAEKAILTRRVEDLEDSIEKGFGIKTRIVKTEILCEFNKLELVVLKAGLIRMLSIPNLNINDIEFYIKLSRKIDEMLPQMEENIGQSNA